MLMKKAYMFLFKISFYDFFKMHFFLLNKVCVFILTIYNISQHHPLCSVVYGIVPCYYTKVPDIRSDGHSRPL